MRRSQLGLCAASLALSFAVVGCGGPPDDGEPIVATKKKLVSGGGPAKSTLTALKATEYGKITGKVTWDGDLPNLKEPIAFSKDPDYCVKGKEVEITQQAHRIGENKGLGNVFVWIEPADANSYFEVPEAQRKPFEGQEVTIRQPHCAFMPHCTVVFPFYMKDGERTQTKQKLRVENDAQVPHNARIAGTENPESNWQIAVGKSETRLLKPETDVVQISCGVHPWMRGYIRAFNHPYAALTKVGADLDKKVYEDAKAANFGTYEIANVPVGVKVRLKAWHEALGFLGKPEGEELTLAKEQTKDFTAQKK